MSVKRFTLPDKFVAPYYKLPDPFGFDGLGKIVYLRTYSRPKADGTQETWTDTIRRVVEGTYRLQQSWIESHKLGWDNEQALRSATEMFDRMWHMKFLPPGRGLWAMGSKITEEKKLFSSLSNCGFVSTEDIDVLPDPALPFAFLMDMSMLGLGVGFDTKGAGKITIGYPYSAHPFPTLIDDTREGWVESVRSLLSVYLQSEDADYTHGGFNYEAIRPAGQPLKTFGGISAGPEPLIQCHEHLRKVLDANICKPLSSTLITDICNIIAKCVVSGNIRRSALISFGDSDDQTFLDLKNYTINPHRAEYGWTSNNSVFCTQGGDYSEIANRIRNNGEPGVAWLENIRNWGRFADGKDFRDIRAAGANPCVEQSLESFEICCLVETFPARAEDLKDYLRTLKFAYLYAKTVTLCNTHWEQTNRVLLRNRRIGCSMSGVQQFVAKNGIDSLIQWCDEGYKAIRSWDKIYSDWLAIPQSIKVTSVKPSGTVSLLAGATPGMHWPVSPYYLRRIRVGTTDPLLPVLSKAGFDVEPCVGSEETTSVVSFPVSVGEGVRSASDVSMWEQLSFAALLQRYWADNQVSCTVSFDPETEGKDIDKALDLYQYQLKAISFLPRHKDSPYPQMPYEPITKQEYEQAIGALNQKKLSAKKISADHQEDRFCDGETCVL